MTETLRGLPSWATDWPIAYSVVQAVVIMLVVVVFAALLSFCGWHALSNPTHNIIAKTDPILLL